MNLVHTYTYYTHTHNMKYVLGPVIYHAVNGPPKIVVPLDCSLRRSWHGPLEGQTLETN